MEGLRSMVSTRDGGNLKQIKRLLKFSQIPEVIEVPSFSKKAQSLLQGLIDGFSLSDALEAKKIEKVTDHDVKAGEYFLKQQCQSHPEIANASIINNLAHALMLREAMTKVILEDINNLAHAPMLGGAMNRVILPVMDDLIKEIYDIAEANAQIPMLCCTHGQLVSSTTLGKEMVIFAVRLSRESRDISQVEILGKFAGAMGNYNAHLVAYPDINYQKIAEKFITSLGISFNPYVTQIIEAGEIGSSTMPHKMNPIDFENSEGNCRSVPFKHEVVHLTLAG
ncbi:hypothetical protein LguiA_023750 [Lonicera macranthoides]